MQNNPKYLDVLKYLYDRRYKSIHYSELEPVIFSQEIRNQYRHSRGKKLVIDGMVCRYMGKLCRKDYCAAEYQVAGNYPYFIGYYIRNNGIELLKKNKLI